jgi:hypothetical protein
MRKARLRKTVVAWVTMRGLCHGLAGLGVAVGLFASSACASLSGLSGGQSDGGDAAQGTDTGQGSDLGATEASACNAGASYNDLTDPSFWSTFDTTAVSAGAKGFVGAAYDGRYVYLVPYDTSGGVDPANSHDGVVLRLDTQAAFAAAGSWSTFDTTTVNTGAAGFFGAVFDGRYLYFVPRFNQNGPSGVVARYDTTASFTAASSWSTFDATSLDANATGFAGGTFDGRYVYFAPGLGGIVIRFDTTQSFGAASSWTTFDATTAGAGAKGFFGAVFDGRYVYLAPLNNGTVDGVVARYDTSAVFTATSAWSTFDTTTVNPAAFGYRGGAFDGRYVYFVTNNFGFMGAPLAQYDTHGNFAAPSSWSTFASWTVNPEARGFLGAAFDGRFVYYVPNVDSTADGGTAGSVVLRFDSQSTFSASGFTAFDMSTLVTGAAGFAGAVFDGRYVYLVPNAGSVVARFDAKTPASMPCLPGFHGSFL